MAESFCKMLWFILCLARSHAARLVQNETAEKVTADVQWTWVLGDQGASCTDACKAQGGECLESKLQAITTAQQIMDIAAAAGVACNSESGSTTGWSYDFNPAQHTDPGSCGDGSCQGICSFGDTGHRSCAATGMQSRFCPCTHASGLQEDQHKHDYVKQIAPKVWVQGDKCWVALDETMSSSGILFDNASEGKLSYDGQECCSKRCEVCGGPQCADAIPWESWEDGPVEGVRLPSVARCCTSKIVAHTDYCGGFAAGGGWGGEAWLDARGIPPCIMPDFECKWGLKSYDGKECCPAECNVCGGSECNKKDEGKSPQDYYQDWLSDFTNWTTKKDEDGSLKDLYKDWHSFPGLLGMRVSWADKCCTGRISHMCSVDGIAPCKLA